MRGIESNLFSLCLYGTVYLIAITAICLWHTLALMISLTPFMIIPLGFLVGCQTRRKHLIKTRTILPEAIKLWLLQSIGLVILLILAALWLARFPHYGDITPLLARHISINLFIFSMLLSVMLMLLTTLNKQHHRIISVNLFFRDKTKSIKKIHMLNFWLFRTTMTLSLLACALACSLIATYCKANPPAILYSIICVVLLTRLPWFYQLLQRCIKSWKVGFAQILFTLLSIVVILSCIIAWLTQPFGPLTFIDLSNFCINAPLIAFWGFAILMVTPISFLIAPHLVTLRPSTIFLLSMSNPLLIALLIIDEKRNLLSMLQNLSGSFIVYLSIFIILLSYYWLNSKKLAQLNALFYSPQGSKHQGPMVRTLVMRNLSIFWLLIISLLISAPFMIQIELFVTAMSGLITYSALIYFFRVVFYEH